jgi:IclR family pca regulon transcriptional regulator
MSTPKDQSKSGSSLPRSETMGGLVKGLAIIELFGAGYDRLTVADAARGSDTTRAAARRCLLTMMELGYLEHDGKYFTPRPRMRRLGGRAIDTGSLAEYAQPILVKACEELDEPVSLAVLDGRSSHFVARAVATRLVFTGVQVGGRLPAYCSATGRLLLGTLENEEIRQYLFNTELIARTPRTIVDANALFKLILEIRHSGVAYSDEELELGMRSMAVAVRGRTGEIIAAISVSTSSARVSQETIREVYRPVLENYSAQLTRGLNEG